MPRPQFSSETRKIYSNLRKVGIAKYKEFFSNEELKALINIVRVDLDINLPGFDFIKSKDFYSCPINDLAEDLNLGEDIRAMLDALKHYDDALVYLECLTALHRRRTRYAAILKLQPLPQPVQVFPRSLLEYINGTEIAHFLANWLVWRKWVYDIDNRAAQETGLLFEPILTAALGGTSYSAKDSPIRRTLVPTQGRQVDCVVEDRAYEFKMRVTIAASGQGRFKEELTFAEDVENSKPDGIPFKPHLIVLDPTESSKLTELSAKYEKHGGRVFTGDAAWDHLEESAGERMGKFLEKYVRAPLQAVEETHDGTLQDLRLSLRDQELIVEVGDFRWTIARVGGMAAELLEAEANETQTATTEDLA